jgi:NAD(P)-dependent dehydrogenase (short-subunit alcohol dehydrogenase family)/quinol monooxygenase YgiN
MNKEFEMDFAGKTMAIIGGGGGIGREIALQLADLGVDVFVGDIDPKSALATAQDIKAKGRRADAMRCDLGDDASVAAFADSAFTQFGRVDFLFNHAGASAAGLLEQVTSEDWHWMLNINLVGLGRSVTAFLPRMTEQGGGWIINTSSGLGLFQDVPLAAPYAATKAAIIAYSRSLAIYTRNRGIGVSVFCPDLTATPFMTAGRLKGIPPELAAASLPVDRIQSADAVARQLIAELSEEKFLISATPQTSEMLKAMAEAQLEPGSENYLLAGQPARLSQQGSVKFPGGNRDAGLAAFGAFAEASKQHWGCIRYDFAPSDADDTEIQIFETFQSQAALDAHSCAPDTLEFVFKLLSMGAADFKTAKT